MRDNTKLGDPGRLNVLYHLATSCGMSMMYADGWRPSQIDMLRN